MMTMEQKFYSMTMKTLVTEAEKLGVKIDKKGSKQKAVEKMLAAIAEQQKPEETTEVAKITPTENEPMIDCTTEQEEQEQEKTEVATVPVEEEEETKKKERKPRQKKENPVRDAAVANIETIIKDAGLFKTTYEKTGPAFIVLRTEEKGRVYAELYIAKTDIRVNLKEARAQELGLEYTKREKYYYLPATVRLAFDDMEKLADILTIETEE